MDFLNKKSPDQQLEEEKITQVEQQELDRVFNKLVGVDEEGKQKEKFGEKELSKVVKFLNYNISKQEIEAMIWEADDDLDGYINKKEFMMMYKRCVNDKLGLEPNKLFNLVQFLMYDKTETGKITEEETLELLYVRYGMSAMTREINSIFGEDNDNYKIEQGQEKEISFQEYLDQLNKKILAKSKKLNKK